MKRNKFMSSRISDIHSTPGETRRTPTSQSSADDEEARLLFQRIKKEAEDFGISGLGEKAQRAVQLNKLTQLGAKPKKQQRMPLAMGVGMAKAAAKKEEARREQSIAEGIVPAPRKRKREAPSKERGLAASEGRFKDGVLYVKPPAKEKIEEKPQPGKKFRRGRKGAPKKKKKGKSNKGNKGRKSKR